MAALKEVMPVPASLRKQCYQNQWVVHAQPPFGKPQQIIEYLARYTYKTAISNARVKSIDPQRKTVTFSYKDYCHGGVQKLMRLEAKEFIRRFQQHILPKGFRRIRHYGILSSSWKKEKLPHLQLKLADKDKEIVLTAVAVPATKHHTCVHCGSADIVVLYIYDNRGPPPNIESIIKRKTNKINNL